MATAKEQTTATLTDDASENAKQTPAANDNAAELAALRESNEALQESNRQMAERMAALEARLEANTPMPMVPMPATDQRTALERGIALMKERRIKHQMMIEEVENALREGENLYQVSLEDEVRMTRMVGASDELEAQAKYFAYFGIIRTKKEIAVTLVSQVA